MKASKEKIFSGMLVYMFILIALMFIAGCSAKYDEKLHCTYYSVCELAQDEDCSEDLG